MRLGHMNNPKRNEFGAELDTVRRYIHNGISIKKCENQGSYKVTNDSLADIYIQVKLCLLESLFQTRIGNEENKI